LRMRLTRGPRNTFCSANFYLNLQFFTNFTHT